MSVNEERKRRFAERAREMKYGSIIKHLRKRKGGLKRQRKITLPVARERERKKERHEVWEHTKTVKNQKRRLQRKRKMK